jgi:hypothetical protein
MGGETHESKHIAQQPQRSIFDTSDILKLLVSQALNPEVRIPGDHETLQTAESSHPLWSLSHSILAHRGSVRHGKFPLEPCRYARVGAGEERGGEYARKVRERVGESTHVTAFVASWCCGWRTEGLHAHWTSEG